MLAIHGLGGWNNGMMPKVPLPCNALLLQRRPTNRCSTQIAVWTNGMQTSPSVSIARDSASLLAQIDLAGRRAVAAHATSYQVHVVPYATCKYSIQCSNFHGTQRCRTEVLFNSQVVITTCAARCYTMRFSRHQLAMV